MDDESDNPIMFYYSKGFVPVNRQIHFLVKQEIAKAAKEQRRPNPNIFDQFGKIKMELLQTEIQIWRKKI